MSRNIKKNKQKTIGSVHVTTGIMGCGNLIKITDDYAISEFNDADVKRLRACIENEITLMINKDYAEKCMAYYDKHVIPSVPVVQSGAQMHDAMLKTIQLIPAADENELYHDPIAFMKNTLVKHDYDGTDDYQSWLTRESNENIDGMMHILVDNDIQLHENNGVDNVIYPVEILKSDYYRNLNDNSRAQVDVFIYFNENNIRMFRLQQLIPWYCIISRMKLPVRLKMNMDRGGYYQVENDALHMNGCMYSLAAMPDDAIDWNALAYNEDLQSGFNIDDLDNSYLNDDYEEPADDLESLNETLGMIGKQIDITNGILSFNDVFTPSQKEKSKHAVHFDYGCNYTLCLNDLSETLVDSDTGGVTLLLSDSDKCAQFLFNSILTAEGSRDEAIAFIESLDTIAERITINPEAYFSYEDVWNLIASHDNKDYHDNHIPITVKLAERIMHNHNMHRIIPLISGLSDYVNMKTDAMNALNAFGYMGMSMMQLNDFGFIQVNGEPDNEINVFQHMFAMTCIMKNINAYSVAYVMLKASEDNNSYNGYLHADFNHVNSYDPSNNQNFDMYPGLYMDAMMSIMNTRMSDETVDALIEQVQDAADNPDYGDYYPGMLDFPDGLDENGFPFYYDE